MSVLIRGMEMPKSCDNCWALDDYGDYPRCRITEEQRGYNFPIRDKRMDKCPFVEVPPHGRLIDADAFVKEKQEWYCKQNCERRKGIKNGKECFIYKIGEAPCRACEIDDLISAVDDAPTIIDAEYPPSITFDEMWESLKKQDTFFVEVEEEVKKLKAEGKL